MQEDKEIRLHNARAKFLRSLTPEEITGICEHAAVLMGNNPGTTLESALALSTHQYRLRKWITKNRGE